MESIRLETIPDTILQALDYHYSPLSYLQKEVSQFIDITDELGLAIEPKDNGQPITDSNDEKVRKKLEHVAKKKVRYNNLHTPV